MLNNDRSGSWRAGCAETCKPCSEGRGWRSQATETWLLTLPLFRQKATDRQEGLVGAHAVGESAWQAGGDERVSGAGVSSRPSSRAALAGGRTQSGALPVVSAHQ